MSERSIAWPLGAAMAVVMAAGSPAAAQDAPVMTSTTIMPNLDLPWDMAFLPDGTMFYTEKCRGLSVRLPSGATKALLGMNGSKGYATTADDLFCEGQAGMMGVAVDPQFASNRTIFVYSTSSKTAPGTNRVMRLTVNADFSNVGDRTDIIDNIPYKPKASDHPFGGPGAHNGGRIRFNPGDGFLYVTTGDTHNGVVPQSPTMLGGKVLRVDRNGAAAPGNNAPAGFDPRIFTYGHRNVQGITFRPSDRTPIIAEHGPWHSDEVTILRAGGNGGWDPRPNVGGRGACPDNYCGYSPNQMDGMDPAQRAAFMPMTDTKTYPDAMKPIWVNNGLSQGTSSIEFLTGPQWKAWNGRAVVGTMGIAFGGTPPGQRIDLIELSADGASVASVRPIGPPMPVGRVRSLVQGPDGNLYVAVDEGQIHMLKPN